MNKIGYSKVGQPIKAGSQKAALNSNSIPSTQAKMPKVAPTMSKAKAFSKPSGMNSISYSGRK